MNKNLELKQCVKCFRMAHINNGDLCVRCFREGSTPKKNDWEIFRKKYASGYVDEFDRDLEQLVATALQNQRKADIEMIMKVLLKMDGTGGRFYKAINALNNK